MSELYKKEMCTYCGNDNCINEIQEKSELNLTGNQMSTTRTIKCDGFVCKKKRMKERMKF